jgi:hypothetical protein
MGEPHLQVVLEGNPVGRHCILVDDIVITGTTSLRCGQVRGCRRRRPRRRRHSCQPSQTSVPNHCLVPNNGLTTHAVDLCWRTACPRRGLSSPRLANRAVPVTLPAHQPCRGPARGSRGVRASSSFATQEPRRSPSSSLTGTSRCRSSPPAGAAPDHVCVIASASASSLGSGLVWRCSVSNSQARLRMTRGSSSPTARSTACGSPTPARRLAPRRAQSNRLTVHEAWSRPSGVLRRSPLSPHAPSPACADGADAQAPRPAVRGRLPAPPPPRNTRFELMVHFSGGAWPGDEPRAARGGGDRRGVLPRALRPHGARQHPRAAHCVSPMTRPERERGRGVSD